MANNKRTIAVGRIIKTLQALKQKGLEYDRKAFLQEIMREMNICEKTAIEYLNVGLANYERIKDSANEILLKADKVLDRNILVDDQLQKGSEERV